MSESASSQSDLTPINLEFYKATRAYIEHEDGLINNRLTWALTIHGFLYASFALTAQKIVEIREKSISTCKPARLKAFFPDTTLTCADHLANLTYPLVLTLILIAVVGVFISGIAYLSIKAAQSAIEGICQIFPDSVLSTKSSRSGGKLSYHPVVVFEGTSQILMLPALVGGGKEVANRGFLSASGIPWVMISSWMAALIGVGYFTLASGR